MPPSQLPEKRVHITQVRASSGKPITSFLDYSPRTIEPPSLTTTVNGNQLAFNAKAYAAYLVGYDAYLVKFFQVRRQFMSLLREVPTDPIVSSVRLEVIPGRQYVDEHTLNVPTLPMQPRADPPQATEGQLAARKGRKKAARRRQRANRRLREQKAKAAEASTIAATKAAEALAAKSEAQAGKWTTVVSKRAAHKARAQAVKAKTAVPAPTTQGVKPNRKARRYAMYGPPRSNTEVPAPPSE